MRRVAMGVVAGLWGACTASGQVGSVAGDDASAPADVTAPRDASALADASAPRDATAPRDVTTPRDVTAPRDVAAPDAAPVDAGATGVMVAPALGALTARQVPTLAPTQGLKAFPGAEGFGAQATGGRGGRVIYVTSLASTGPGTLAEALAATGPRYVLFKVSGLINATVRIAHDDVTVAGQTSPGGITVRGIHTDETPWCDSTCGAGVRGVDNFVVRHLRTRPGPIVGTPDALIDGDALRLRHSRRVMIDHVSCENAVDEAVEISYSNNVTIQDSIIAETVGGHANLGGMLINYSNPDAGYELDALAIVRTTWVRIQGRYPEMSRQSAAAAGSTARIELANNLLWDQRYYIDSAHSTGTSSGEGAPVYYNVNWVGNVGVTRPGYPYGMMFFPNPTGRSRVYFRDDHLSAAPARVDWALVYCCNDFATSPPIATAPAWAIPQRHPFPAVTYIPSADVRPYIVAHAGAFPRDPMDRRLIGYVASGMIPTSTSNTNLANDARLNDWGATPPAPPVDTDSDGMPDAWERAHNLDPAVQDHNGLGVAMGTPTLVGYTNLEVYLAELAEQRLTEGRWGM